MDRNINEDMVSLEYVYHDCFLLERPECRVVFDYWREAEPAKGESPAFLERLGNRDKPLYVLVSHHHKDHFVKEIFSWRRIFPNIHYVLSKDTARSVRYMLREESLYKGERVPAELVTVLMPGETFTDGTVGVEAFASTDTGNSYVVRIGESEYLHAGDLNAWIWKDESTPREMAAAIRDYERILDTIAERHPRLEIAMFPVDSRIGRDYWEGAARLVRKIYVERFVPMHFELADTPEQLTERHLDAVRFGDYANPERGEYIGLTAPGDKLAYSL